MMNSEVTLESVKEYYGKVLESNQDLKTTACCSSERLPEHIQKINAQIHLEVREKFYGCGAPFPPALEGKTVLDLGCGSGRDSYLLSSLVGPTGRVIGIDMTDEQLGTARKHLDYHARQFGYCETNVQFLKGYIEDLASAGIADNSIDLIVSNCVINLSPNKRKVFQEIFRVLKPGGELYFSDVFANRRIPIALTRDPLLLGECLGGCLYTEDFRRLLGELGIRDFRAVSKSPVLLTDPEVVQKIGMIDFSSITFRVFKIGELEDKCEDYGQVAYYLGTLPHHPHTFSLDDHHHFETGRPMPVCSNTAFMVSQTRYAPHFKVEGDCSTHYGLFDCGPVTSTNPGACC